jgi:ankyrin repeat protein
MASREALVLEFLERACLSYGHDDFPSKWRRAERILARFPETETANLFTAVVAGNVDYVRHALVAEPRLANTAGGPQDWQPLLFLCYGRVATPNAAESALAIGQLLLDAGADPNAHFLFDGDPRYRFTALTGVMGQGELGQPEHAAAEQLARLLLEHGADANDSQGLYDTHLVGDDTRWLELLFGFGLNAKDVVNWDPEGRLLVFDYLLAQAASSARPARLRWLLDHGANPNARSSYTNKTCYQLSLLSGHPELAELLVEHGAQAEPITGVDAFIAAVRGGERARATALLEGHPEYLTDIEPLLQAALEGDAPGVRLLLELGMDPNGEGKHGHRALHNGCNHRAVVEALWQHGADPTARCFGGTPAGWSLHGKNLEMARLHAERGRSIFDAVATGHVKLVDELLRENPARALERSPSGGTPLHELPEDLGAAEPIVRLLLEHGTNPTDRDTTGKTAAVLLEERGRDPIADLLDSL